MDAQNQATENLLEQMAALQQEVAELKIARIALEAQNRMLENLLNMAESPKPGDILETILQQAYEISCKLTGAESGCLVFLGSNSAVQKSIPQEEDLTSVQLILTSPAYINWADNHRQVVPTADVLEIEHLRLLFNQPPFMRSLLSVPILRKGKLLAVLTLMHSQPGYFGAVIANFMQSMSRQIALATEYARCYDELDSYSNQLKQELERAREIQRDFLPNPLLSVPGWEFVACFYPARQVAGDFYDTFRFPDGSIGLVVGDVCDKGVGAALFMGLFRSLLRIFSGYYSFELPNGTNEKIADVVLPLTTDSELAEVPPNTVKIIDALKAIVLTNNYIAQNHERLCMFATIFFGVLNPTTGVLTYINGGHVPPIIVRASGTVERLKPTGPAVGTIYNIDYEVKRVQLEPGDIVLSFSDGVPDARSLEDVPFTENRLLSLLEEPASSAVSLVERIKTEIKSHIAEADPFDDITMLAVRQNLPLSTNERSKISDLQRSSILL
ncbi:SpoIIE family protein phosphatase [Phormidium sp. LEGE 05292]|uniref:PP2C family protein-serine/threonine phosphatase n=1 Tax=[Phormidium] sp. LEGE 05292 TaxID=767427 RepID=UPI00188230CB|nr:GAF domain-containing SpoIIE family protein phosphatase [Phormidium sp. LEGE 05292]MBE9224585.1 SpoIIE family protein phosphatase [Phormidium sp. LEGE 05292]